MPNRTSQIHIEGAQLSCSLAQEIGAPSERMTSIVCDSCDQDALPLPSVCVRAATSRCHPLRLVPRELNVAAIRGGRGSESKVPFSRDGDVGPHRSNLQRACATSG